MVSMSVLRLALSRRWRYDINKRKKLIEAITLLVDMALVIHSKRRKKDNKR